MNKLETILALSDCLQLYRMNSGVDRMAKCLADPTFDPMEVHFTRDRVVSDGVEEMRTTFRGKSKDPSGKVRTDEREGLLLIPKHKVVVEEFYKTPQVHEQEFKNALANLKIGQRFTRDLRGVRKETVQMLGAPWPLGLTNTRLPSALERLENSPHFSVPVPQQPRRKSAAQRLGEESGQ